MKFILNILNYIFKVDNTRIEHHLIQNILLITIILYIIPVKRKIKLLILFIILIVFFRTIKLSFVFIKAFLIYKKHISTKNMFNIANEVFNETKIVQNFYRLPKYNSIILLNYPNELFEYLVYWYIPKNLSIVSMHWLNNLLTGLGMNTIQVQDNNSFESTKEGIREKIKTHSVCVYINRANKRLHKNDLGIVRTGIFHIAHQLQIPVTPVVVDILDITQGYIPNQKFEIFVGDTTLINNPLEYRINVKKFFKTHMKRLKDTKYTFKI